MVAGLCVSGPLQSIPIRAPQLTHVTCSLPCAGTHSRKHCKGADTFDPIFGTGDAGRRGRSIPMPRTAPAAPLHPTHPARAARAPSPLALTSRSSSTASGSARPPTAATKQLMHQTASAGDMAVALAPRGARRWRGRSKKLRGWEEGSAQL